MLKDLIQNRFLVVTNGRQYAVLDLESNQIVEVCCTRCDAVQACIAREKVNNTQTWQSGLTGG